MFFQVLRHKQTQLVLQIPIVIIHYMNMSTNNYTVVYLLLVKYNCNLRENDLFIIVGNSDSNTVAFAL